MKSGYDIIIRPVLTEKSYAEMADKKYTFRVAINANKTEIKNAIEEVFPGVKVESVNTMRTEGKIKRQGRTQGRRPEKGVHHRVGQNVRVRMSEETQLIGYFNAAEDELSPRDELMYVVSVSYSEHYFSPSAFSRSFSSASATAISSGEVIFMLSRLPGVRNTFRASFSKIRLSSVQSESSRKALSIAER